MAGNNLSQAEMFKKYYETSRGEEKGPKTEVVPVDLNQSSEIDLYKSYDNIDDVDRLVDLIRQLLERAWAEECPVIVDQEPSGRDPIEVKMPMIVYDYYDRVYAEKTKKAPNLIRTEKCGEEIYEIYQEFYECSIQFDICHETTRAAKVVSKKFEIFLKTYIPYFKYIGVSDMWFFKEPKAENINAGNQKYFKRSLIYHVKLERRYIRRQNEGLRTIQVVLGLESKQYSSGIPEVISNFGIDLPKK